MSAAPRRRAEARIRDMRARDVGGVLDVERASYRTPWSREMFMDEIARPGSVCLVADDDGLPVGHLVAAAHAEVWHVLNVCVHPGRRRAGLARRMLEEMMRRGRAHAHRGFTLEVRASNAGAIALYRHLGFTEFGVRPRYYSDDGEDAVIMWAAGEPE